MRTGQRGQALVELALALPLLLLTVLGGADLARVYAFHAGVETAARAAAEAGAVDTSPTAAEAEAVARAELAGVPGLDPDRATITFSLHGEDDVRGSCPPVPTLRDPCFATVRVRYTFRPLIAWPGVPGSIELDRTRSFRRSE